MVLIISSVYNMGSNKSVGCHQIEVFIDHPYFNQSKVITNNSVSKLLTTFPIQENLFRSWQQQLASHQILSQFAFLPQKSHFTHERLCSVSGSVEIVYDNFPYLLKNQIHDRAGKKDPFTEEQLWYLILAIFSVKRELFNLKINNGILGNITPQNIFLSQKSQIKIGNCLSWPENKQNRAKVILSKSGHLIAPEDFIQLQLGMSYCKATESSQMFAIGMIILSAVILKNSNDLYNFEGEKFNFNQALIRIQQMKDLPHYSDTLKAVVELMCAFDVMDRLKMHEISEIIFRCENSIKLKKKFIAYPVGQKLENKFRQYKNSQNAPFHIGNLSILSSVGPDEFSPQSPQNSNLVKLKRNSLNLTQVIFGPQTHINKKKSSNNTQSLMSSDQFITFKKTQSDSKKEKEKPLQRYQQINANFGSNSLNDMDYLYLINIAKQVIVQKPVVIDTKRKSDDIEEEITPVETPLETPNQSNAGQQNQAFKRPFLLPKEYSQESLNFNFVQKNPLSKTTTIGFRAKTQYPSQSTFRVKSVQSQDQYRNFPGRRQEIMKTQNSALTIYIPMNDSFDQSMISSWQSKNITVNSKTERKILYTVMPSLIQEFSKEESSQVMASRISQKDKECLESLILQKLQQINASNTKTVKFGLQQEIMEQSHESKILQIDDIELNFMNDENHKIQIWYKEPNENQILVELISILKKNSFLSIKEEKD